MEHGEEARKVCTGLAEGASRTQGALGQGGISLSSGRGSQGPWSAEIKGSLTETEEQCVHTHAIDAEEAMCDQVGADDHCLFERRHLVPAQL